MIRNWSFQATWVMITSILMVGARVEAQGSSETGTGSSADHAVRLGHGSQSAAWELLQKRVDRVDWSDITFEEVLDWLRSQGEDRVNVVPRWGPLNLEGVNVDRTVSLQLRGATIAEILNETMDQLSDEGRVAYRAIGDTVRISTKQDFERKMEVRVYEVTDVIFQVPDFGRSAPTIDLEAAARAGGQQGGGGSGQSVFGGGSSGNSQQDLEVEEEEVKERLNELRTTILQTIAPETWGGEGSQGGGRGVIRIFNNRALVVFNTIEVHEMIAGYFSFDQ